MYMAADPAGACRGLVSVGGFPGGGVEPCAAVPVVEGRKRHVMGVDVLVRPAS